MKILIRNLHNQQFTVECDEDNSIKELKEKIAVQNTIGEKYDPELIKLLCGGKVMDDEDAVSNYTIKPESFLVLVKQLPGKPKPPPKKKPYQGFNNMGFGSGGFGGMGSNGFGGFGSGGLMQSPFQHDPFGAASFQQNAFPQASHNPNAYSNTSFSQGSSSSPANKFKPPSPSPAAGGASAFADANPEDFSTPQDREEAIQYLLSMGFNKDQSEKALRASFYNVEAAVEYITSGNIHNVPDKPAAPQPTGTQKPSGGSIVQPQQPKPTAVPQQSGSSGGMNANLQQMQQMLKDHPEQLQVIKQTLQAEHPEIAQLIDENPQAFIELINQASRDVPDNDLPVNPSAGGTHATPTPASRTLSARDQEIIGRLQEMGFDRERAIEAYLTCDRNENMAVNYLLNTLD